MAAPTPPSSDNDMLLGIMIFFVMVFVVFTINKNHRIIAYRAHYAPGEIVSTEEQTYISPLIFQQLIQRNAQIERQGVSQKTFVYCLAIDSAGVRVDPTLQTRKALSRHPATTGYETCQRVLHHSKGAERQRLSLTATNLIVTRPKWAPDTTAIVYGQIEARDTVRVLERCILSPFSGKNWQIQSCVEDLRVHSEAQQAPTDLLQSK